MKPVEPSDPHNPEPSQDQPTPSENDHRDSPDPMPQSDDADDALELLLDELQVVGFGSLRDDVPALLVAGGKDGDELAGDRRVAAQEPAHGALRIAAVAV